VDYYDPSQAPDPDEWLELDEQERLLLVERHHRRARIKMPNVTVHATIHVAVENQLAANDEPVIRAFARVMKQGLSRHDAVHAIGSVLAAYIYNALKLNGTPETLRAEYYAAIERLTAEEWLNSNDG
jgi:hypothetical protein